MGTALSIGINYVKFVPMKVRLLSFFIAVFCATANAQEIKSVDTNVAIDSTLIDSTVATTIDPGTVSYVNSLGADSIVELKKRIAKENCPNLVKGFRVQIFSCAGSDCQEKAEKNYNQFLIAYPEISAVRIWEAPSYKVRVGNCRTRFEAEAIKAKIKKDFPFIFIVPDFIDSPFKVECNDMK